MPIVDFTYAAYGQLIDLVLANGYKICKYTDVMHKTKACILRHDVDFSLEAALRFAEMERGFEKPVCSTYFVLLRSDFYNCFTKSSIMMLRHILDCGHDIGLHFDEAQYNIQGAQNLIPLLVKEANMLSQATGQAVTTVSMHRPSPNTLAENWDIPGIVNSYGEIFFKKHKYLSDSRMCWREDAEVVICSNTHEKLHVLTHPFWYAEQSEDTRAKLLRFICKANYERYLSMRENFRDINEFVATQDIINASRIVQEGNE